ncbi:MAG: FG-GAP-like repeat-containing protein [Candidatus Thorarchaeota archaeon]|jgi:streptogramin lyase
MKKLIPKILSLGLVALFLVSLMPVGIIDSPGTEQFTGEIDDDLMDSIVNQMNADFNLTNEYQKIWEPNNIRGSTHAIAVSDDNEYMATAGGYLNDREVHIYRWFDTVYQYYPIWDAGDGIIQGDVMDVAFMDCDNNNRLEVVAACADGHIYVFEQIGDRDEPFHPFAEAHIFELVWDSGLHIDRQVWSVEAYDIDHDSHEEIIAGAWDGKVYVFDYIDHSAYPFCLQEHWIHFEPVWDSGDIITDRVHSIAIVDSDNDTRMEIVAGSQDNKVYLFEERPCLKHTYELRWTSGDAIWAPVTSVTAHQDLDDDHFGEIVASAYGQGVFIFDYNHETEDFDVLKINQGIKSWERATSAPPTNFWTGYEADEWIDRKIFGWNGQGIYENDPIPPPWDTDLLGGTSALGGPMDDEETTFDSTEQFVYQGQWDFETGTGFGEFNIAYDIAVAPDMSIYITDFIGDRVTRFTDTMEPILTFGESGNETGQFDLPTGITVDEEGFVYVADGGNSRVQKFTPEGDFIDSWGTNGSLDDQFYLTFDVAVWEDKLFVSDYGNHRIQVLNKDTGDFLYRFGSYGPSPQQFDYPSGLAFDTVGRLAVCDYNNHRIQQFYSNGTYAGQVGTPGVIPGQFNHPIFVTTDSDDRIYVSDSGNERVQKFSPSLTYESEFGTSGSGPGEFTASWGLAVYPLGGIIVLDPSTYRLQRFGVQEYELLEVFSSHNDQSGAFDVEFDSEGNFYVTDHATPYVFKFNALGQFMLNWTLPEGWFAYAWGVEIDENDNVFIYDGDYNKIYRYDTEGNLIHSWGVTGSAPGELRMIRDIALDNGSIYVTEQYNDRISVFDYDGNFIRTWGTGGLGLGEFDGVYGIEIGPNDLVYTSEQWAGRIQRFFKNGTAIDYWLSDAWDVFMSFDDQGFLYTSGASTNQITKYTADGVFIDAMDYEMGNPEVENVGLIGGLGMTWLSANQSLVIADNSGEIFMLRPYLALNDMATAIVDFGKWEELGGDSTDDTDMIIVIEDDIEIENVEFWISNDMKTWEPIQLSPEYYQYAYLSYGFLGMTGLLIFDVDHALRNAKWDEFRYMKIGVKGGAIYDIDAAFGTIARSIETALVVSTGYIRDNGLNPDELRIIVGTVDGEIMAYRANGEMVWESQADQPKFNLGTQIWDIVQVNGKGMVPTWVYDGPHMYGSTVTSSIPTFSDFISYQLINIDGTPALDLVATIHDGGNARLLYWQNTGTNDAPVWSYQSNYFVTHSTKTTDQAYTHATVMLADLDGDYDDDMILCDAGIDPDTGFVITVRYFERTSASYWTERSDYLGPIQSLCNNFDWVPRITAIDLDYDGDKDFTVSLDKLYYFEQTGYSGGFGYFLSQDDSFYQEINVDRKNETVFGKVAFWDFDLNGVIDIIVPHATENYTGSGYKCETGRWTYWRNTGTRFDQIWTKDRSMFEPDFTGTLLNPERGYDCPQFADLDGDGLLDLIAMNEDNILKWNATLDHDSFLVATYPYVHMVEVDKRAQAYGYWGYEAYDSWTNWIIFEGWSRALEYGDVDQDGKPEVFVGSFDNNIIAFEQVANNTYRRSWRSHDFMIEDPITGVVYPARTNIKDMVIGDQDNDGKEEIIVTAAFKIYVFEVVEDDIYEMVWESGTRYWEDYGGTKVGEWLFTVPNVLGVHEDLDGDRLPEIIVGCDEVLTFFENTGDNQWEQVGYLRWGTLEAGAPDIKGISTGDVNRDNSPDVVVVGTDEDYHSTSGELLGEYGWVRFIQCNRYANGTYIDNSWYVYDLVQPQGAAYCVDIADFDFDTWQEVFVGTSDGVTIWEMDDGNIDLMALLPTENSSKAVRVGNTDGDTWYEVVTSSGKNLTVFEQNQTYDRKDHVYDNVWSSGELHEEISDIRLGDSNVNERMEIIATAKKGYLYAFEWIVNSSSIATSPDPCLAEDIASVSEQIQQPVMAILDGYHRNLERLSDIFTERTRRFGIC